MTRPPCKSLTVLHIRFTRRPRIRFGQWFCSRYISEYDSEYISEYDSELQRIFNMPSTLAVDAVDRWLLLNHYWDLPPSLKQELKK